MGTEFTEDALRLGIISAVAVVILLVAYAVTLGVGFASLGSPDDPIGDPMFTILEVLIISLMPAMVALKRRALNSDAVSADERRHHGFQPPRISLILSGISE